VIQSQSINTLSRNDKDMSISRVAPVSLYYNYSYTSLYKDEKSLLKDLQMSYKCFIFIKEVAGNYLTSFIIKGVYYLIIIKPDVIDLRPLLISRIDSYKHLILRI
jgi:hypothetical protein